MNIVETTIKKITPGSAIRAFCVSYCGGVFGEVKTCDGNGTDTAYHACPFHRYRLGRGRPSVKIIRRFCLQCMGNSPKLVGECATTDCVVHLYRMGKNPARIGKGYFANRDGSNHAEITLVNGAFTVQNR
jgi:hypothetical protein